MEFAVGSNVSSNVQFITDQTMRPVLPLILGQLSSTTMFHLWRCPQFSQAIADGIDDTRFWKTVLERLFEKTFTEDRNWRRIYHNIHYRLADIPAGMVDELAVLTKYAGDSLTKKVFMLAFHQNSFVGVKISMRSRPTKELIAGLHVAAGLGYHNSVAALITEPRIADYVNHDVFLVTAVREKRLDCVKILLTDARCRPGINGNLALIEAIKRADTVAADGDVVMNDATTPLKIFKLLLDDPRVDPGAINSVALTYAFGNSNPTVVKMMLDCPRVNARVIALDCVLGISTPELHECSRVALSHPRIYEDSEPTSAFVLACTHGQTMAVQFLLRNPGFNPNICAILPLYMAINSRFIDTAMLVLQDTRFDPGNHGDTLIDIAMERQCPKIVRILLDDARINPVDRPRMQGPRRAVLPPRRGSYRIR